MHFAPAAAREEHHAIMSEKIPLAEQIGAIDELVRETEAVKFQSYGTQQRLKALRATRETLAFLMNHRDEFVAFVDQAQGRGAGKEE